MSLINEMLRDLEDRRRLEKEQGKARPSAIPLVMSGVSSRRRWMLLFFVFMLLVMIGVVLLYIRQQPNLTPVVNQAEQTIVPAIVGEKQTDSAPSAEIVSDILKTETVTKKVGDESFPQPLVDQLISLNVSQTETSARLELQFSNLRGYHIQPQVKKEDPLAIVFEHVRSNPDLLIPELSGVLQQISLVPQENALKLLIQMSSFVQVRGIQGDDLESESYELALDFVEIPVSKQVSHNGGAVEEQSQMLKNVAVQETTQRTEAVVADVFERQAEKKIPKDLLAYEQGQTLLRQQKFSAAEASFGLALSINPRHSQARLQLITLLLQRAQMDKAEQLVKDGLTHDPTNFELRKMYARMLLERQQTQLAVELLNRIPQPQMANDLEYYALLAGLLQDAEDFSQSADIYRRLLQLRPRQALWWLGLGVALEQISEREKAQEAYRQALSLPGLRQDLQQFVSERIELLN
jgi:tetratricopeptide (TPR) repeat protein